MKHLLYTFLLMCFASSLYSQDYVDTARIQRIRGLGISLSNHLHSINRTKDLISEHGVSVGYKFRGAYIAVGIAVTNKVEVSPRYYTEYNLVGGRIAVGLDFFNYKNKLIIPFYANFSYYPKQFIDRGGILQHFSYKMGNIGSGIEYRPFKPKLFIYGATGLSWLMFRNIYKEPNGTPYDIRNGGFVWSLDIGIKYYFTRS